MASASRKVKDGGVTEYELKVVEYELMRSRNLEENERRMAVARDKSTAVQQDMEANCTPKKKRKVPSHAPVSMNEGHVLRSNVTKEHDHVDPAHQPSKGANIWIGLTMNHEASDPLNWMFYFSFCTIDVSYFHLFPVLPEIWCMVSWCLD